MNDETAFPAQALGGLGYTTGMSLRDYFAAKAMDVGMNEIKDYYGIDKDAVAKWCFEMADAMLRAREA
jgi:hypothetical protein